MLVSSLKLWKYIASILSVPLKKAAGKFAFHDLFDHAVILFEYIHFNLVQKYIAICKCLIYTDFLKGEILKLH